MMVQPTHGLVKNNGEREHVMLELQFTIVNNDSIFIIVKPLNCVVITFIG